MEILQDSLKALFVMVFLPVVRLVVLYCATVVLGGRVVVSGGGNDTSSSSSSSCVSEWCTMGGGCCWAGRTGGGAPVVDQVVTTLGTLVTLLPLLPPGTTFCTGRSDGSLAVLHTLGWDVISHGGLGRLVVVVVAAEYEEKTRV
jgi:hypothetical protein